MTKLLTATAVALLLAVGPALAADDADVQDPSGAAPEASQSDESSVLPSDPELKPEEEPEAEPPLAASEADEDGAASDIPSEADEGAQSSDDPSQPEPEASQE